MIDSVCGPRIAWASRVMRRKHWHGWLTPLQRATKLSAIASLGVCTAAPASTDEALSSQMTSNSTAFALLLIGLLLAGLGSCIGAGVDTASVITAGADVTDKAIPIAPNAPGSPRRAFDQAMIMRWVASALEMFPHSSQKASRSLKGVELSGRG